MIPFLPWLIALWRSRTQIEATVEAAVEVEQAIERSLSGEERGQPLPYSAIEAQRRQIDSAISFKVAPAPTCQKAAPGWYCTRAAGHLGACALRVGSPHDGLVPQFPDEPVPESRILMVPIPSSEVPTPRPPRPKPPPRKEPT